MCIQYTTIRELFTYLDYSEEDWCEFTDHILSPTVSDSSAKKNNQDDWKMKPGAVINRTKNIF